MTSVVVNRYRTAFTDREVLIVDLDVTAYAPGGELITNAILGLAATSDPLVIAVVGLENPVVAKQDEANDKLLLYTGALVEYGAVDVGVVRITVTTRFP